MTVPSLPFDSLNPKSSGFMFCVGVNFGPVPVEGFPPPPVNPLPSPVEDDLPRSTVTFSKGGICVNLPLPVPRFMLSFVNGLAVAGISIFFTRPPLRITGLFSNDVLPIGFDAIGLISTNETLSTGGSAALMIEEPHLQMLVE